MIFIGIRTVLTTYTRYRKKKKKRRRRKQTTRGVSIYFFRIPISRIHRGQLGVFHSFWLQPRLTLPWGSAVIRRGAGRPVCFAGVSPNFLPPWVRYLISAPPRVILSLPRCGSRSPLSRESRSSRGDSLRPGRGCPLLSPTLAGACRRRRRGIPPTARENPWADVVITSQLEIVHV